MFKTLRNKVKAFLSSYRYIKEKKRIANKSELKLSPKKYRDLIARFEKFIDDLDEDQMAFMGGLDNNLMIEEMAFNEACKFYSFKKIFTRGELEALMSYYYDGMEKDAVNKKHLVDIDVLIHKFKEYCLGIFPEYTK